MKTNGEAKAFLLQKILPSHVLNSEVPRVTLLFLNSVEVLFSFYTAKMPIRELINVVTFVQRNLMEDKKFSGNVDCRHSIFFLCLFQISPKPAENKTREQSGKWFNKL